jgi:multidrug efflux pump subunit AcrA (membrane-fusion protein)
VDITLDSLPGQVWRGTVSTVNAATTQGTLSYLARVILPNSRLALKSGMVANASFIKQEHKDVVLVPRAAVFQGESGDAVYVLNKAAGCKCDGKAKIVNVRRGLETDTEAEVNGIQPGTQVLVQRPDNLKDGSPVSITPLGSQSTSTSGSPQ